MAAAAFTNVVDDEFARVGRWLLVLAQTLGARAAAARAAPGRAAVRRAGRMVTEIRGVSNARAEREVGWRPAHPTWREGLVAA